MGLGGKHVKTSRKAAGFFLLVLAPVADASAQARSLTIEAIFGGELSAPSPSQLRWAPDGSLSFFFPS